MSIPQRTLACGEPRLADVGRTVVLLGWAHKVRDMGGILFVDLRDRTGIVQIVVGAGIDTDVRTESCVAVVGEVKERDARTKNAGLPTGDVEIVATSVTVVTPSAVLPFPVSDEKAMASVNEELRVKYRYLDLRRPAMYRRLAIRHSLNRRMRRHLDDRGFLEVETPVLTKSTPEGARDYLVPYRLQPGLWYALPQSPQQYKQMLMVAGVERYYQFAKCFRDEASRADRQPEFMQLDLEMSFVEQEDVLALAEGCTREAINGVIEEFGLEKEPVGEFTRLTYDDAMDRYGCDKPDLRFGLELFTADSVLSGTDFRPFADALETGGTVRGVRYPGGGSLARKATDELAEFAKGLGASTLVAIKVPGAEAPVGAAAKLSPEHLSALVNLAEAEPGDLVLLVPGERSAVDGALYRLRLEIGDRLGLKDPRKLHFAWVTDFPLVERDEAAGRWSAMHHPFTSPKPEDFGMMETDPGAIRAAAYDMVCNGFEVAGGSIRIHSSEIQARMFGLLGIDEETQRSRFGHILEAFTYGPPPHGGIAWGFERSVMLLTDTENIREVIPFPKVGAGTDPFMGAPDTIDAPQWAELGLKRA